MLHCLHLHQRMGHVATESIELASHTSPVLIPLRTQTPSTRRGSPPSGGTVLTLSKPCSKLTMRPSTSSLLRAPPALYMRTAWRLWILGRTETRGAATAKAVLCAAGRMAARAAEADRRTAERNILEDLSASRGGSGGTGGKYNRGRRNWGGDGRAGRVEGELGNFGQGGDDKFLVAVRVTESRS